MGYKVLLAQDVSESGKELLKENGCEVILAPREDPEVMKELIKDCDACFSKTFFFSEDILKEGKKLQVVSKHGVCLLYTSVNTADEARQIVSYAKYPPLGHRGASTQRAHTNYDPPKLEEYFEIANARTIILAQIETRQALDHVGEIAAVEGIDAVVIGPNDLSIDLGVPGDLGAPAMKEAQRIVAEAAARAGKASGMITSRTDVIRECRDCGMTVLSCDSEVGMLLKMARKVMGELQA